MKLDATRYRWSEIGTNDNPFAHMVQGSPLPVSVGEVRFDNETFAGCEYRPNGVSWSYYGSGTIGDYAAVQLADGDVLFCVLYGHCFAGTFASADDIRMKYYRLTPLP